MIDFCISDVTLRAAVTKPDSTVSFNEKLEIVRQLDRICADVIEAPALVNDKADILFLHTICPIIKNSVLSCDAGLTEESVEKTYEAIKTAKKVRLLLRIPVSTVQMEYVCKKKPAAVLGLIASLTEKASKLCGEVEVSFLDSTRAEHDFLVSAVNAAIDNGAKYIDICDNAGTMLPDEFGKYIKQLYNDVPSLSKVVLSVECSNHLGLALANTFAAVSEGARQIKINSFAGEGLDLAQFARLLRDKKAEMGISCELDTTKAEDAYNKICLAVSDKKDTCVFDSGSSKTHTGKIELTADDDIKTVSEVIEEMGYELSDEDLKNVYGEFVKSAGTKTVGANELDTIIAGTSVEIPRTYKIKSYVINSGNIITPTANIELEKKDGEVLRGLSVGEGPIDAAFLAIEKIVGKHYELDDFKIWSVTRGYEALGMSLVKLRCNGKLYSGSGTSTDIVGASIKAYIHALNKICYEEDN